MGLRSDVRGFAGFLAGVPAFVRQRMTEPRAREIVRRRLKEREQNFLNSLELFVYSNPKSPYQRLLDAAQSTLGDVRSMLAAKATPFASVENMFNREYPISRAASGFVRVRGPRLFEGGVQYRW